MINRQSADGTVRLFAQICFAALCCSVLAVMTPSTAIAGKADEAVVFLIAGQSNAGGVAAFSPETNAKAGLQKKHPTTPGSTAKEVGIPTTKDAYPRSYIWKPRRGPFERLTPGKNLQTCYRDPWRHGIELPMAMLLEKQYPNGRIYFVKHGPGGHNLHTQWKAGKGPDYRNFIEQYKGAMTDLKKRHKRVRVLGLYWDQGESDQKQAKAYEANLRTLFAALRKDTNATDLQIYVREQGIFQYEKPDFKPIVNAQVKICEEDPNTHLLKLDLGSNDKNFKAWAWSIGNGHLSSKAYMELSRRIMEHSAKTNWPETLRSGNYAGIAIAYADYMIQRGRDVYGKVHSPLFMTVLNRKTGKPFKPGYPHVIAKPYAPGLRRDHKMRPYDRTYVGSNPLQDLPLYGLLYRLTELTGDKRYGEEADKSIAWFLEHGWSKATKLPAWGSHMYYHVGKDVAVFANGNPNSGYGGHEYNFVWPYWGQGSAALTRFARELWNQHINNKKTGHFNRHSKERSVGMEFPETGACFMEAWTREYGRNGDPEMKKHVQVLLGLFRSMRDPRTGAMSWCSSSADGRRENSNVHMNLSMATKLQDAAKHVDDRDPGLAKELRAFAGFIDDEYLANDYNHILDVAGKGILGWYKVADRMARPGAMTPAPEGVDATVGFPVKTSDGKPAASLFYLTPWFPGRSYAEFGIKLKNRHMRCEKKHKPTYRRALLDIADIYLTIGPEVQFAQYPDNVSDVVELLRYVYALTEKPMYLHRADQMMKYGLQLFFDETSPLPKITNFDDWYESSSKNESSVEILRQMLELSLDLEKLPDDRCRAPVVKKESSPSKLEVDASLLPSGSHRRFAPSQCSMFDFRSMTSPDMILQYDPKKPGLYLTQQRSAKAWRITLSDTITRIPSAQEADKLNGRMGKFTGKGMTGTNIAYGGFKAVPVAVTLVIRNVGKRSAKVTVAAGLHDTYHDNGQTAGKKTIKPGGRASFEIEAPPKKWIRHLTITGGKLADLQLERVGVAVVPRSKLGQ